LAAWKSLQGRQGGGTIRECCHRRGAHGVRRRWGESHCPASLAGATGRFLVQKGHGDEALLLAWSNSSEAANRRLVRSKAVRSAAERWEGEALWVAASSVTSGAGIRGGWQPTWGGDDRRPPALSCSPRGDKWAWPRKI
jgi:hypothetical protein